MYFGGINAPISQVDSKERSCRVVKFCIYNLVDTAKWFSKVEVSLQFLLRKEWLVQPRMSCEESVGLGNIFKMERGQLRCLVLVLKEESSTQETEKFQMEIKEV